MVKNTQMQNKSAVTHRGCIHSGSSLYNFHVKFNKIKNNKEKIPNTTIIYFPF